MQHTELPAAQWFAEALRQHTLARTRKGMFSSVSEDSNGHDYFFQDLRQVTPVNQKKAGDSPIAEALLTDTYVTADRQKAPKCCCSDRNEDDKTTTNRTKQKKRKSGEQRTKGCANCAAPEETAIASGDQGCCVPLQTCAAPAMGSLLP
jgi:hypothetical protein